MCILTIFLQFFALPLSVLRDELKFNKENKQEGIFFINEIDAVTTKVTVISIPTEGKLMFQIPVGLTAGKYRLEVRKAYTNEKIIRLGVLSDILFVR